MFYGKTYLKGVFSWVAYLKVFQYIIQKISISMYNKEIWLAYAPLKIVYEKSLPLC